MGQSQYKSKNYNSPALKGLVDLKKTILHTNISFFLPALFFPTYIIKACRSVNLKFLIKHFKESSLNSLALSEESLSFDVTEAFTGLAVVELDEVVAVLLFFFEAGALVALLPFLLALDLELLEDTSASSGINSVSDSSSMVASASSSLELTELLSAP